MTMLVAVHVQCRLCDGIVYFVIARTPALQQQCVSPVGAPSFNIVMMYTYVFCANCTRFLCVIARFYCKLSVNIRNILCSTYVFTDSYCQYHSTYFAFGSFCLELFVFLAVPRLAASDRLLAAASIIHCFEFLTDFSKISYSCLSKCQSLG